MSESNPPQPPVLIPGFVQESSEALSRPDRIGIDTDVLYPLLLGDERVANYSQQWLLSESSFVSWVRDRGIPAAGIVSDTDGERFWKPGWIRADEVAIEHRSWKRRLEAAEDRVEPNLEIGKAQAASGRWGRYKLKFHPFRMYPLLMLLNTMEWRLTLSSALFPKFLVEYSRDHVAQLRKFRQSPRFTENLKWWNGISDLLILLEPLYWPRITGHQRGMAMVRGSKQDFDSYKSEVLSVLSRVYKAQLANAHRELRWEASRADDNAELYLLLRCADWSYREKLKDDIGLALWIRHMAEVLRHGFEELYEDRLPNEDIDHGKWFDDARDWVYGSEYPLDDTQRLARRISKRMQLPGHVAVRVYVEGDTEQGALEAALEPILGRELEIVNLKANFGRKRSNRWDPGRLREELQRDVAAERISMVLVDSDREDIVKCLKKCVEDDLIVGMIQLSQPDFEGHNFSPTEMLEASRIVEQKAGLNLEPLDSTSFESVTTGSKFEDLYCKLRPSPGLKGKDWGVALLQVAYENRSKRDDESRPIVHFVSCCWRSTDVGYMAQKDNGRVVWDQSAKSFRNVKDPQHPFLKPKAKKKE